MLKKRGKISIGGNKWLHQQNNNKRGVVEDCVEIWLSLMSTQVAPGDALSLMTNMTRKFKVFMVNVTFIGFSSSCRFQQYAACHEGSRSVGDMLNKK